MLCPGRSGQIGATTGYLSACSSWTALFAPASWYRAEDGSGTARHGADDAVEAAKAGPSQRDLNNRPHRGASSAGRGHVAVPKWAWVTPSSLLRKKPRGSGYDWLGDGPEGASHKQKGGFGLIFVRYDACPRDSFASPPSSHIRHVRRCASVIKAKPRGDHPAFKGYQHFSSRRCAGCALPRPESHKKNAIVHSTDERKEKINKQKNGGLWLGERSTTMPRASERPVQKRSADPTPLSSCPSPAPGGRHQIVVVGVSVCCRICIFGCVVGCTCGWIGG